MHNKLWVEVSMEMVNFDLTCFISDRRFTSRSKPSGSSADCKL